MSNIIGQWKLNGNTLKRGRGVKKSRRKTKKSHKANLHSLTGGVCFCSISRILAYYIVTTLRNRETVCQVTTTSTGSEEESPFDKSVTVEWHHSPSHGGPSTEGYYYYIYLVKSLIFDSSRRLTQTTLRCTTATSQTPFPSSVHIRLSSCVIIRSLNIKLRVIFIPSKWKLLSSWRPLSTGRPRIPSDRNYCGLCVFWDSGIGMPNKSCNSGILCIPRGTQREFLFQRNLFISGEFYPGKGKFQGRNPCLASPHWRWSSWDADKTIFVYKMIRILAM